MKKIIMIFLIVLVCFLTASGRSEEKTVMYRTNGEQVTVSVSDIQKHKESGLFETEVAAQKVMYAPDGRELSVWKADVEAYKNVGWFENLSDVQKVMYAPDGRELTVWKADIEAYKNVGWFENISDVQKVMYAPDGRELTVWKADIEAYKNVGWYENLSDVRRTLHSLDGREITVWLSEVPDYINVWWYPEQDRYIDPSKPMLALTFDDGPKAQTTSVVLDTLETYNARATFFVLGTNAEKNGHLLSRMANIGCSVGSHTYSHPILTRLSDKSIASQLSNTSAIIKNATGTEPALLRPPYGEYNDRVGAVSGKPLILWSVDTLDWKYRDVDYVKNYVLSNARDGAVILLHDIHPTTAQAVQYIIPELIKAGYQLVTVEELAMYKGYTLAPGENYHSFE